MKKDDSFELALSRKLTHRKNILEKLNMLEKGCDVNFFAETVTSEYYKNLGQGQEVSSSNL